jgi:hypothetical protein
MTKWQIKRQLLQLLLLPAHSPDSNRCGRMGSSSSSSSLALLLVVHLMVPALAETSQSQTTSGSSSSKLALQLCRSSRGLQTASP